MQLGVGLWIMPELPDVETQKRYLDSTALYQEIDAVDVRDAIVLDSLTPAGLEHALVGQSFQSTRRHGKHLFVELKDGAWLGMHFGMTGSLKYFKNPQENPDYDQVMFHFRNDYHLAYIMARKLGRIRLIDDLQAFLEGKQLGPDSLDIDFDAFHELLVGRRGMIKSALMNQAILAGIGNVYSDEILFQAGVHPRRQISDLDAGDLRSIYAQMCRVLDIAIENQANPDQFPASFLTPRRSEGDPCPRCGGDIQRTEVSGRGSYYCPNCQS